MRHAIHYTCNFFTFLLPHCSATVTAARTNSMLTVPWHGQILICWIFYTVINLQHGELLSIVKLPTAIATYFLYNITNTICPSELVFDWGCVKQPSNE